MSFIWTEDRVDSLRVMWCAGKTSKEIAAEFGWQLSASAVLGKARRLKLSARSPSGADRSRKFITPSTIPRQKHATTPKSDKVADAPVAVVKITKAPGARLVPFLEIEPGECRFVVEDRPALMCGAPVRRPGEAWCPYHHRIVYVPASARSTELRRLNAAAVASTRAAPVAIANGW